MIVVDAGVVIAILDRNDVHHGAATRAIDIARAQGDLLVLPASAYSEVLVSPSRAGLESIRIVDALIDGLPMAVEPIDRAVATDAAAVRAERGRALRLPDALVLATARTLGADRIMTTDSGLPSVGIRVELLGGS